MNLSKVRNKTISDFDNQWKLQGDLNDDYWCSDEILLDQLNPIFMIQDVENNTIADIGAGTGRVVRTFLKYNPKKIYAIEPSDIGIKKISNYFKEDKKIEIIQSDGIKFKTPELCDIIFSLGVVHHIKNPTDVFMNIKKNLKPGGKIVLWVYGYENNQIYIFIYKLLSFFTKRLPDKVVLLIASLLNMILVPYLFLCKYFNLPCKKYFINVFSKCGWQKRKDMIFDQLNPAYAKYYKKNEIEKELLDAGFNKLQFHHRHGYSWIVVGKNV